MYLNPGFGGMLLQAIFAIVAVGGGILYSLRRKIRALFKKDKTSDKQTITQTSDVNSNDAIDVLANDE